MTLLIVESNPELADLWRLHCDRRGRSVVIAPGQAEAVAALRFSPVSIVLLNVELDEGSAFAVADYASYRCPEVKIIFVTSGNVFSDGSIFNHVSNACTYVPVSTRPEDLAEIVEHYAAKS